MKQLAHHRPILFVLLIMGILEAFVLGFLLITKVFLPEMPLEALDLPFLLINAIVAGILLTRLGWWRDVGFNRPSYWRSLWLYLVPVALLIAPALWVRLDIPVVAQLIPMLIIMALIGFQEEAIYRGIMLHALQPMGVMRSAFISAFLFSIIHANSFLLGRDPMFVVAQLVASFLGGFALAALRIKTNTIWFLIALHTLNDFIQFTAIGGIEATDVAPYIPILKIVIASVMFAYGLFILRNEWLPRSQTTKPIVVAS